MCNTQCVMWFFRTIKDDLSPHFTLYLNFETFFFDGDEHHKHIWLRLFINFLLNFTLNFQRILQWKCWPLTFYVHVRAVSTSNYNFLQCNAFTTICHNYMQFVESLHERLRFMLEKRITLHILTSAALFILPTGFNPEDLKLNFFEAISVCWVAVCSHFRYILCVARTENFLNYLSFPFLFLCR